MKKLLVLLGLLLSASTALASNIAIKTGVSYWYTDSQGSMSAPEYQGYKLKLDKKSVKGKNNGFAYFTLENSVPGVPNFRVAYNHLKSTGTGKLNFSGDDYSFKGNIDFSHYDLTAYYHAINSKVVWDLGLTARKFDGKIAADFAQSVPLDKTYGFVYSDLKVHVFAPEDGFLLGFQAQVGKTGKEQGADANLYFQYTLPEHIGITMGYRYIDIELHSNGKAGAQKVKVKTNYISHGPHLGLHLQF